MKKQALTLAALTVLSANVMAQTEEHRKNFISLGQQISFGVEGLDLNINQASALRQMKKFFNSNYDKNELSPLIADINFIKQTFGVNSTIEHFALQGDRQVSGQEIAKLLSRNGIVDTVLAGQIYNEHLNTAFGAKISSEGARIGDSAKQYFKVKDAYVYTDTQTPHFSMKNVLYFKHDERNTNGLDRFRINAGDAKAATFSSRGQYRPTLGALHPTLDYGVNIDSRARTFTLAPGFAFSYDTDAHELSFAARYFITNDDNYRYSAKEFAQDAPTLAPGVRHVEYFKNWEQCDKRDVAKGCLKGDKLSSIAIGEPTGALYSERLSTVFLREALDQVLDLLPKRDEEIAQVTKQKEQEKAQIEQAKEQLQQLTANTTKQKEQEQKLSSLVEKVKNDKSAFDLALLKQQDQQAKATIENDKQKQIDKASKDAEAKKTALEKKKQENLANVETLKTKVSEALTAENTKSITSQIQTDKSKYECGASSSWFSLASSCTTYNGDAALASYLKEEVKKKIQEKAGSEKVDSYTSLLDKEIDEEIKKTYVKKSLWGLVSSSKTYIDDNSLTEDKIKKSIQDISDKITKDGGEGAKKAVEELFTAENNKVEEQLTKQKQSFEKKAQSEKDKIDQQNVERLERHLSTSLSRSLKNHRGDAKVNDFYQERFSHLAQEKARAQAQKDLTESASSGVDFLSLFTGGSKKVDLSTLTDEKFYKVIDEALKDTLKEISQDVTKNAQQKIATYDKQRNDIEEQIKNLPQSKTTYEILTTAFAKAKANNAMGEAIEGLSQQELQTLITRPQSFEYLLKNLGNAPRLLPPVIEKVLKESGYQHNQLSSFAFTNLFPNDFNYRYPGKKLPLPLDQLTLVTELLKQRELFIAIKDFLPVLDDLKIVLPRFQQAAKTWGITNLTEPKEYTELALVLADYKDKFDALITKAEPSLKLLSRNIDEKERKKLEQTIANIKEALKFIVDTKESLWISKMLLQGGMGILTKLKPLEQEMPELIDKITKGATAELLQGIDNIINRPEQSDGLDWLAGMHLYQSEHQYHSKKYGEELIKHVGKFEDTALANGIATELGYRNKNHFFDGTLSTELSKTKHLLRANMDLELAFRPQYLDFVVRFGREYKDVHLGDLRFGKLTENNSVYIGGKFATENKRWLFKPALAWTSETKKVQHKSGGVKTEVFKRDAYGNVVKKDGSAVAIAKLSKHAFKEAEYQKQEQYGDSGVVSSVQYLEPSFAVHYQPNKHLSLNYKISTPVQIKDKQFGGMSVHNSFNLNAYF